MPSRDTSKCVSNILDKVLNESSNNSLETGGGSQLAAKSDTKKRVAATYQQNFADFIPPFGTNNTHRAYPLRSKSSTSESKTSSTMSFSTNNKHIPFMEFADPISTTKQTPFTTSSQQKLAPREPRMHARTSNRTKEEPKGSFPVISSTNSRKHVNNVKYPCEVHAKTVPPTRGKNIILISDDSDGECVPIETSSATATSNPEQNQHQQEQIENTPKLTSSATLLFEEESETDNGGWDLGKEEIKEDLSQEELDLDFNVEDDELDPWM
ncbi:9538_t:CDS:1 [Ambispora gerdemannii]|uniref:9538_t:CDS:1 n=1 Tax=Ambispora gerdemannii TaxID=144530 RepID=A0A9N9D2X3_9GLOM|nr:9538_t:CDS:1 [Ambispora gerdemannii]